MTSRIRILPGLYKSNNDKLAMGIWPWAKGLRSRLPLHYKKRYIEKFMRDPVPVHFYPNPAKWTIDEYGVRTPVQNIPVPLVFPPESHIGLWGGEGFIEGYAKRRDLPRKPSIPRLWKPRLYKKFLYSEILNQWMEIPVTKRTLDLIDEAHGFDHYILKTHEVDLQSRLGMKLKRDMLMALTNKSTYADDPDKQQQIYEKYKEYLIPAEEVAWLGLSLTQAENKQAVVEEGDEESNTAPLKFGLAHKFLEDLKIKNAEDDTKSSSSMFSNPFAKS